MFSERVDSEVAVKVAPDIVHVVRAILHVVVFEHEAAALEAATSFLDF
jgi:hypothetical protein